MPRPCAARACWFSRRPRASATRPPGARARPQYMASGAVAGMAEHMLMYPVDTVKTRMQALGPTGQGLHAAGVFRAVRVILLREGVGGLRPLP